MDLTSRVKNLVADFASADSDVGIGFMSCAVYDTAWVAMVAKPTAAGRQWLFPQCFDYILDAQQEDGSWPTYAAPIDGILNTAASLLAVKKHADTPYQISTPSPEDLEKRIVRGTAALERLLNAWDVDATTHVGFEFLVPTLLQLLEKEGIRFDFPGRAALMAQNRAKMARFKIEYLYTEHKMTAIHSLEAFLPSLDYNKVRHHKEFGALMASPSSTAAYLMSCSPWDDESESYLRDVVELGAGRGSGGIPSAFPSTYFESTWMLTTLLKNGYTVAEIGAGPAEQLAKLLSRALNDQKGILGFAPSIQPPDVDDTAKALTALCALGQTPSPMGMIERFETDTHFKTYDGERNPSFSANCNALVALLSQPDPSAYQSQITKILRFLIDLWWVSDGWIEDKWNLSEHYSTMLMAEAFSAALTLWDAGKLPSLPEKLVRDGIVISLFQALIRTLQTQNDDGSWGTRGSREETSYAVLTIAKTAVLPVAESLHPLITKAIESGKRFIDNTQESAPVALWIEKVSYGSAALTESYSLAALRAGLPQSPLSAKTRGLTLVPEQKVKHFTKFYSRIPLFAETPAWKLQAALVEGYLFLPKLREMRLDIFPRTDMEDDKYFEYIPFTWTSNSNLDNKFLSSKTLLDMMIISFLNYQADEFMEAVVGRYFGDRTSDVVAVIDSVFAGLKRQPDESMSSDSEGGGDLSTRPADVPTPPDDTIMEEDSPEQVDGKGKPSLGDVRQILHAFITYVMRHPAVQAASVTMAAAVEVELRTFLLSHLQQAEDNNRFTTQPNVNDLGAVFQSPRSSFYRWVQSTSSDHTSCPYSFSLYQCLLVEGLSGRDCFPSVQEKYIAEAMCRHLAVLCRMYNDYGSLRRDRDEKNLNSINFPDFHGATEATDEAALKARLYALAEYERGNVERAFARLQELGQESKVQRRMINKIRVFINVTDLYGQIYVARDIASRM